MEGHHVLTQLDGVLYGAIGRWRAVDKLELELRPFDLDEALAAPLE